MKHFLILVFVITTFLCNGQSYNMGKLEIIHTNIIKKKKQEAVMLQVRLSDFNNMLDTVFIYKFHKNIPSLPFVIDSISLNNYNKSSVGLTYLIEDEFGDIIEAKEVMQGSFVNIRDEINNTLRKEQVNKKTLKIKKNRLNYEQYHGHELSKFILLSNDTVVNLYPLLNSYHYLTKGRYKLFLFYSFNKNVQREPLTSDLWNEEKPKEDRIYKGVIISNKIDLIVK